MAKVLMLYYSSYGHMEQMANAAAEVARQAGAEAVVKRAPELVPEMVARKANFKLDQPASIATVDELPDYDAIILGIPTRYGRMVSQMANFLDQTGGLWARGALHGKIGSGMSSTATPPGGEGKNLFLGIHNLLPLGMVIVGLPYSYQGQMTLNEIVGGSPYGATTITGGQGQGMPSPNKLEAARFQGKLVAETAAKLAA